MPDKKSDNVSEAEVAVDAQQPEQQSQPEPVPEPVDDLSAKVDAAIQLWVANSIYNSPVSRDVESINHVKASLGLLRDAILQAVK